MMLRYLNLILFLFTLPISLNSPILIAIDIAYLIYIVTKSRYNLLFVVFAIPLTILKFNNVFYLMMLTLILFVITFIKKNDIVNVILSILLTLLSNLYLSDSLDLKIILEILIVSVLSGVVSLIISVAINPKSKVFCLYLIDAVIVSVVLINFSQLTIELAYLILSFYLGYFIKNKTYVSSLILVIVFSLYSVISNITISYYIIIVLILISMQSSITSIVLLLLCNIFNYFSNITPHALVLYSSIGYILFELYFIIYRTKDITECNITSQYIEIQNNRILNLSSFLETYALDSKNSVKYQASISKGIETLKENYCKVCYRKSNCFKDEERLNKYLKNCIVYLDNTKPNNCIYQDEIKKASKILNDKYSINSEYKKVTSVVYELLSLSNILKHYAVDNCSDLIDFSKLEKIKNDILTSGVVVKLFEVNNLTVNQLDIDVKVCDITFNEVKQIIETIFQNNNIECSCKYIKSKSNSLYLKIIPLKRFSASVGVSKLKSELNQANGDNFYIDEASHNLRVYLCDGMGHGNMAYKESNRLIKLISSLRNILNSSECTIDILNMLLGLNKYTESYSTLDYLEVDLNNGKCKLFKCASSLTFLIKKDNIIKYENKHLPLGEDEFYEPITFALDIDDLVILCSDGIIESDIKEKDIVNYISQIKHLDSQKIANEIINYINRFKRRIDDMSVVVVKLKNDS